MRYWTDQSGKSEVKKWKGNLTSGDTWQVFIDGRTKPLPQDSSQPHNQSCAIKQSISILPRDKHKMLRVNVKRHELPGGGPYVRLTADQYWPMKHRSAISPSAIAEVLEHAESSVRQVV